MTGRAVALLIVSVAALGALSYGVWIMTSPALSDRPYAGVPQPLTTHVADTMAALIDRNAVEDPESYRGDDWPDSGSAFFVARANVRDDPSMLDLTYGDPDCPVVLPSARMIALGYVGGVIDHISVVMPLKPLAWEALQPAADDIVARFNAAGWQAVAYSAPLVPGDFLDKGATKWAMIGTWTPCDGAPIKAVLLAEHYNSLFRRGLHPADSLG